MPAALKLHHAERSGLLHHTSTMLRGADMLCELYPFLDADLLAAGVILHDLCKIEEMKSDELGLVSDYTTEGNLLGHLVLGVSKLDRCGREMGVNEELLIMLEHMILSHHDLPEYGSPKPPDVPGGRGAAHAGSSGRAHVRDADGAGAREPRLVYGAHLVAGTQAV